MVELQTKYDQSFICGRGGCKLVWTVKDTYSNSSKYTSYICNGCGKSVKTTQGRNWCSKCSWDVCGDCVNKVQLAISAQWKLVINHPGGFEKKQTSESGFTDEQGSSMSQTDMKSFDASVKASLSGGCFGITASLESELKTSISSESVASSMYKHTQIGKKTEEVTYKEKICLWQEIVVYNLGGKKFTKHTENFQSSEGTWVKPPIKAMLFHQDLTLQ